MTAFKNLGLSDDLLQALTEMGFENPTEIQEAAIPFLVNGDDDLIGLAQTGTGKTAAFGLPLLNRIDISDKQPQALILAPTRELGQQIAEQLNQFSKYQHKLKVLAVYGGASIAHQIKAIKKGQHIIVATPGRLVDLIKRKVVNLNNIRFLILDEADEMLNMGFKEELNEILKETPEHKLTWLFAATMPKEIKKIVHKYMHDPVEVRVNQKNVVNKNIEHQFAVVKHSNKTEALTRFLDMDPDMRGVVFCRTKRDTQELAEDLITRGYKADAIHGDLSQPLRDRVMKRFKSHDLHVLVATDVAARGIDVNDLTHVFHYTLPDDNDYYTHRSGRTARAGKTGISIAFLSSKEKYKINRIEKDLGIAFEQVKIASAEDIIYQRIENWCQQILEKKFKKKLDPRAFEMADLLFGNLSKEELIAKVVMNEVEKMSLKTDENLNDSRQDPPKSFRANKHKRGDRKFSGKKRYKKSYRKK